MHDHALSTVAACVGPGSGGPWARPPGATGRLAIDTITGEVLAGTPVGRLPHDILTIEPLGEGSTGGDV
jgi:hypothetical protein